MKAFLCPAVLLPRYCETSGLILPKFGKSTQDELIQISHTLSVMFAAKTVRRFVVFFVLPMELGDINFQIMVCVIKFFLVQNPMFGFLNAKRMCHYQIETVKYFVCTSPILRFHSRIKETVCGQKNLKLSYPKYLTNQVTPRNALPKMKHPECYQGH